MDDPRAIRRFVRPLGRFKCEDSNGTVGYLNASIEFTRCYTPNAHHDEPVGYVLFWGSRRVEWIEKGRYRTSIGTELVTTSPDAP